MRFEPLGDQAVLAYAADEDEACRFAASVRRSSPAWLVDVLQAYASVAAFYDLAIIDFAGAKLFLGEIAAQGGGRDTERVSRRHLIPCCYDFGLDMERIALATGLEREEIIRLHQEPIYTVFAIGFCPGFPYLGYLPDKLARVPRLESPRLHVEAGSVGLTGRQTGIYTLPRPGGWNIAGKTPLELVHVEDGYFPLRTGDEVKFKRIDVKDFDKLRGERLPPR